MSGLRARMQQKKKQKQLDSKRSEELHIKSDKAIQQMYLFKLFRFTWDWFWFYFWDWTVIYHDGSDPNHHLNPNQGYFYITHHTTHNWDIFGNAFQAAKHFGKLSRCQFHRLLMAWWSMYRPMLECLGGVPGSRDTCCVCLNMGLNVACIPGGAEEAVSGFEKAYTLQWKSARGTKRTGFARCAVAANNAPIVPFTTRHAEEMRWNPFFWFANVTGISRLYDKIMVCFASWAWIHTVLMYIRMFTWITFCWFGIPLPVKVTLVIGEPIVPQEGEDIHELVERCHVAMTELIEAWNPSAPSTDFWGALRERWTLGWKSGPPVSPPAPQQKNKNKNVKQE